MSKLIIVLVGPPASGKSSLAELYRRQGFTRISQDDQGKEYLDKFKKAIEDGDDIVIDRMNFNKEQRKRYLEPAHKAGYQSIIKVLQVPKQVCYERCMKRENHPTIKDHKDASNALSFFFKTYERPTADEATSVIFEGHQDIYAGDRNPKETVVVVDIDGTVADIEHRRHYVQRTDGEKKDWRMFNLEMINDTPKPDIVELVKILSLKYKIVFCSGRTDDFRRITEEWLDKTFNSEIKYEIYMRPRNDSRKDDLVKEVILDFELLTRYNILFTVDDRDQVVKMWRDRGITCLQVDYGAF